MSIVNQTELADLVTALRRYLPTSLEHRCLLGDRIEDPAACALHLATLLRAVSTYLPRRVVTSLLTDPQPAQPRGEFASGTVMCADISGFTAMSEKLSQLGKAGAEEVTGIINRLFTTLQEVSERYGGDLVKFGGDALIIHFGEEAHALRACLAAMQMQEAMGSFRETPTSQGVFRLQMSIGIGSGPLFMVNLGSEEGMEFVVMGQAIARMAQAESHAAAGEVLIDSITLQQVAPYAVTQPRGDGFHQLLYFQQPLPDLSVTISDPLPPISPPSSADNLLPWIADTVRRIRALSPFLPPGVLNRLIFDPETVLVGGEYRPVTVAFANFCGTDEIIETLGESRTTEITAILNAYFTSMRDLIAVYGGVINKVDPYTAGHRLMALFGAPHTHIDDPERAVRVALEMQEAMAPFTRLETSCGTFRLAQRIGINTGVVFAGNVGAPARREYSVMGDGVNLAARLMAVAAEGQILISHSTARQAEGVLLLREQQPVQVKGKSASVRNYLVLGLQEQRRREHRPLIGRDEEWRTILETTDMALSGRPQMLAIVGEAGLGKSRLLDELITCWQREHGALAILATCPSFGRHTPYSPWLDVLRALFGILPSDDTPLKLEKIAATLQEMRPAWRDWSVLIGRLLGLDVEETAVVQALDAPTRQRIIFAVIEGLVTHRASSQPLLLAVDDLHWADEASLALLNYIARRVAEGRDRPRALMLAIAYRTEGASSLDMASLPHYTEVRLRELSEADSLRLLDTLLPSTPQIPQQLKEVILRNAQGNPLFIEAIAHSLIENYLVLDEQTGTYHMRPGLEDVEIPDSVNRIIMSRIDRLDESCRNILRVASVIGQQFWYWLLSSVYPYRRSEWELRGHLEDCLLYTS
ncbi:MAG: AAA family ATPase, partial [Anaerolineae bacterium]|nr:AAA family ATPase [Anaerolineae bacterium]